MKLVIISKRRSKKLIAKLAPMIMSARRDCAEKRCSECDHYGKRNCIGIYTAEKIIGGNINGK